MENLLTPDSATEAVGTITAEAAAAGIVLVPAVKSAPSRQRPVITEEGKALKEAKVKLAETLARVTELEAEVQTQAGKAEFYFKKCQELIEEKSAFNKATSEGVQLFAQSLDVAFKHLSNTLGGK